MRPPPPPMPPSAVALLLLAGWAALATPEASAFSEESTLEALAVDLAGPGERVGYGARRLEEGQDELDVVGASRKVTKRHGDSQVCAPNIANHSLIHSLQYIDIRFRFHFLFVCFCAK